MTILSLKPGHDGNIAALRDGRLLFSLESEKDSFPRYADLTPTAILRGLSLLDEPPDIIALGGWVKGWHSVEPPCEAGYYGIEAAGVRTSMMNVFGRPTRIFSSTHERSHVLGAFGMSPFPQGEPCYALVWEGNLGDFYRIDEQVNVTRLAHVLTDPGNKYAFLFAVGDPYFPAGKGLLRLEDAGKLMALASYSDRAPMTADERRLVDDLLSRDGIILSTPKTEFSYSPFYSIGVTHPSFKNLAGKFSDALFDRFYRYAKDHLKEGLPLVISGGCGLNCEWNSRWEESGLFADVFVPPCANDSGSALGTAIDAQRHYTGRAKIAWDVYAGEAFEDDGGVDASTFATLPLDVDKVARFLDEGAIVAWVQGRCEMGPRALGNRSLLAAPFTAATRERLNIVKQREPYRPIAPIVLEEQAGELFECSRPSPHMLYFQRVKHDRLHAITHVDGSARIQTVSAAQNPPCHRLLDAFRRRTGAGVLCNTSLNVKGRGFINRMSDLAQYASDRGLDGFVVHDRFFVRTSSPAAGAVK